MRALQMLETNLKSLETATTSLQGRVRDKKLNNNYSENEDCLTYSVKVWRSCLRLAELKKLQWQIEGRDSMGKIINKGEKE